ncbi:MAG TPA: class I SAM-dependent methyltransferase [Mycobacteriales bacterium]|jgi:2-polyprenyl-3-methyl-5-hydroxy-6-metoxy-1,4-benzoquinol methylase
MDAHTGVNQRFWDEIAPLHAASDYYDVDGFLAGATTLGDVEIAEVGGVTGLRMAHLMCHIGLDTMSWARRGAQVTGVDFSTEAISIARGLAQRAGLDVPFVCADVFDVDRHLDRRTYDVVFLSRGVLMWVEDIPALAEVCASLLKPGGFFYLLDIHPLAMAIAQTPDGLHLQQSYFHSPTPSAVSTDGSYAISDAGLQHQETREWIHSVGDVVTALINAGIIIEFLHEFPADAPTAGGPAAAALPALFSVRGTNWAQ